VPVNTHHEITSRTRIFAALGLKLATGWWRVVSLTSRQLHHLEIVPGTGRASLVYLQWQV